MTTAATNLDRIQLETNAPVTRLTLRNPPLNILDIPLMDELSSALAEIEADPTVSTILIQGAGNCFSAGVDVAAHTPDRVSAMLEKFHKVIRALVATRKITIAAVHGHCLGGGAELAMVCDIVISTDDASWGFPEISLGCYPPVAATALSALIGQKRASELILTGRTISGIEAANFGLASAAISPNGLQKRVNSTLQRLQELSPAALAVTKKSLYAWDSMHFDKGLVRAEKIYLEELMKTEDAQEGIRAFMEKRPPQWKGK
jgi:cyclohexa-1,5-dienecarbonyl-CoA hydratase